MGLGWMTKKRYSDPMSAKRSRRRKKGIGLIAGGEQATEKKWAYLVEDVASLFIENNWTLTYCGMGSGLAGLIAHAVIEGGGRVKAIVVDGAEPPDLPEETEQIVVKNFHQRRTRLFNAPVGFLILPGGPGTLAEFAELSAWHAAGILDKPVVLLDPDNWFEPIVYFYERAKRMKVSPWTPGKMFRRVNKIESAEIILSKAIEDV